GVVGGDPDWTRVLPAGGPGAGSGVVGAGTDGLTAVPGYGVLQSAGLLFFAFAGYARIATMGGGGARPLPDDPAGHPARPRRRRPRVCRGRGHPARGPGWASWSGSGPRPPPSAPSSRSSPAWA